MKRCVFVLALSILSYIVHGQVTIYNPYPYTMEVNVTGNNTSFKRVLIPGEKVILDKIEPTIANKRNVIISFSYTTETFGIDKRAIERDIEQRQRNSFLESMFMEWFTSSTKLGKLYGKIQLFGDVITVLKGNERDFYELIENKSRDYIEGQAKDDIEREYGGAVKNFVVGAVAALSNDYPEHRNYLVTAANLLSVKNTQIKKLKDFATLEREASIYVGGGYNHISRLTSYGSVSPSQLNTFTTQYNPSVITLGYKSRSSDVNIGFFVGYAQTPLMYKNSNDTVFYNNEATAFKGIQAGVQYGYPLFSKSNSAIKVSGLLDFGYQYNLKKLYNLSFLNGKPTVTPTTGNVSKAGGNVFVSFGLGIDVGPVEIFGKYHSLIGIKQMDKNGDETGPAKYSSSGIQAGVNIFLFSKFKWK